MTCRRLAHFGKSEFQSKLSAARLFEQPSSTVLGRNVAHSDLVEIAKRNGDFKKNYGVLVRAIL